MTHLVQTRDILLLQLLLQTKCNQTMTVGVLDHGWDLSEEVGHPVTYCDTRQVNYTARKVNNDAELRHWNQFEHFCSNLASFSCCLVMI